jgi:hypothetical protein
MASIEIDLRNLGARGVITDVEPHRLDESALVSANNMVIRDGIPAAIGKLPTALEKNEDTDDVGSMVVLSEGGYVHHFIESTSRLSVGGDLSSALTASVEYLPLIERGGEVLWFPQDGVSPIVRWAGAVSTVSGGSFPATATVGDTYVAGSFTNLAVNGYMGFGSTSEYGGIHYRVLRATTTNADLEAPYEGPSSPAAFIYASTGVLGLSAPVRQAQASWAADTLTAATNRSFTDVREESGVVAVRDIVGLQTAAPSVTSVTTVTSATSLATFSGITISAGPGIYQFARPMPGQCGCLHRGRLYTAGVEWMKDAVFIFPAGYEFWRMYNGIDSPVTNKMQARMCKYVNVPDNNTGGRVVALLSTPSYLLVIRNDSIYMLSGEYPTNQANLLWQGDGGIDVRGCIQTRYGQVVAGTKGIYLHDRGGISDLTKNTRKREWQRRVYALGFNPRVCCTMAGRYLLVSHSNLSDDPISVETWVYDMEARIWCGNLPNVQATNFAYPTAERRSNAGDNPEVVMWSTKNENGYSTYNVENMTHGPTSGNTVEPDMEFETGAISGLGDNDRLTNLKLTYELESSTTGEITVSTTNTATFGATQAISTLTSGYPRTVRMSRTSVYGTPQGVLGKSGNFIRLKVAATTDAAVTDIRVHGIKAVVRKRLRRGA